MTAALDTYAELRLAEGKLLRWGERETKRTACALQARDLEILVLAEPGDAPLHAEDLGPAGYAS